MSGNRPTYRAKRGICKECQEARPLTADGLLRRHRVVLYAPLCPGSLTRPTQIISKEK